ncbi:uncharacterized protein [Pyrus communis]|uniref:uncharacterized protein isoform X2 n=1 Tax=Pyrus communis TaxID=23211 RepID=UPI0035C0B97C
MAANGIHFTRVGDKVFPVGFHWTRVGDKVLPVGFGFRPTGQELIGYYLQMKLKGTDYVFSDVIPEINNICSHEPWDLPRRSPIRSTNQEWYFFSTYKKTSKNQTERATKEGFWKITGTKKPVKTEDQRTVIGEKRILTFYQGRVHDNDKKKTDWVMHEYYIPQTNPNVNQRDLVVCCVKKKSGENVDAANCHEGESSTNNNASDFGNQQLLAPRMDIEEEHTPQQQSMDIFEWTKYSMLASALGDHYHEMPSAFGANERDGTIEVPEISIMDWDAVESTFHWDSEPPVDSRHSRGQKDVKLYQIQAASSVNLVPKPQTDRIQVVTDEHSGTHQRTKSDKEAEVAQGNNAEKGLKQTQNAITTGNWKGCFISWEASPPLTSPASVYLFNMVLGVIMFCIFAWEAVLYGQ